MAFSVLLGCFYIARRLSPTDQVAGASSITIRTDGVGRSIVDAISSDVLVSSPSQNSHCVNHERLFNREKVIARYALLNAVNAGPEDFQDVLPALQLRRRNNYRN